jgi:uncharacterized protein
MAFGMIASALLWFCPLAPAYAEVAIPPVALVTDLSGVLSASQQAQLQQNLAAFAEHKGSQIAVLILPTTEPEDIAQFGIRLADAWKLGRKDIDDGAILIVATNDRHVRIEVGRGLEGVVTDLVAHRIVTEYLAPQFRTGDFYGGIDSATDRLMKLVDGEPLPAPKAGDWQRSRGGGLQRLFPLLLVFGLIAGSLLRRVLGRPLGALATGGAAALVAWLLVGTVGMAVFAGIAGGVLALLGGLGGGVMSGLGGGGFGGGGFGGGGFGGGGDSGGGFSGGGGGFGGGGASGSW